MSRAATQSQKTADQTAAAPDLAPLTDELVADQTDANSYRRGQGYFRSGRIFAGVRRGATLRARCHGSSGGPYLVEATLATAAQKRKRNPVAFSCDCPRGGFCKHVVALLLTWIDNPGAFEERPPIAETLANKSREELIALIALIVGTNPDLEDLLDVPAPAGVTANDAPIDETALRRQISSTIPDDDGYDERYASWGYGDYGYEEHYGIPADDLAKLERIVALGEAYAEAGHWQNALRACATFVEEVAPNLASFEDESGEVDALLVRCDETLAAARDAQAELPVEKRFSTMERTRAFDVLLLIWETDVTAGGLDLSQQGTEAIVRAATPEERQRATASIREILASFPGDAADHTWIKQAAIAFLVQLHGDQGLSDEELLREYRDAGLWPDALGLLVRMGRADEAAGLAPRKLASARAMTAFADQLLETGDPHRQAQAIALVDDRLWENEGKDLQSDQILRGWLERRYAEHGEPEKALALVRDRFKASPTKEVFDAARRIALLPGQSGNPWPAVRKDLLAQLRKQGMWHVIIDIHLDDGEISEAIAAEENARKARQSGKVGLYFGWGSHPEGYTARVAAAAEASHPADAVRLYQQMASDLIAARNRESYRQAAAYLARVKSVLEHTGSADAWPPLIAELRQRNKTLRALREELDALGLQ